MPPRLALQSRAILEDQLTTTGDLIRGKHEAKIQRLHRKPRHNIRQYEIPGCSWGLTFGRAIRALDSRDKAGHHPDGPANFLPLLLRSLASRVLVGERSS